MTYKGQTTLYDRYLEKTTKHSELPFTWGHVRKSWQGAERNVIIDFGEDLLFWVNEGIGESPGFDEYVSKEKFINKYGGDYDFYMEQEEELKIIIEKQKVLDEQQANVGLIQIWRKTWAR